MIPRPVQNEIAAIDAMIWVYGHNRKSQYHKTPNLKLVLPAATTLQTAIGLCRQYNLKRKQWYDAVLAATLLENGIHVLNTMNDKDFLPIAELSLINPFTEILRAGTLPVEWSVAISPKASDDATTDDAAKI